MDAGSPSSTSVGVMVSDLATAVDFLREVGFALQWIHPADSPRAARLRRDGSLLDLTLGTPTGATITVESTDATPREVCGPDGIVVRWCPPTGLVVPPVVERTAFGPADLDARWHVGRAGMQYRDLIPDRLGGALIASNIRIERAGPVPDYVHHHDVLFQLIFCRRGWVEVVYEDQGPPFILHAGDCVIQPPHIRHRVLTNSDAMEVVEIGYPAEHLTLVEPDLRLPNGVDPARRWDGQAFVHHHEENRRWVAASHGVERTDTGVRTATNGLADVEVVRMRSGGRHDLPALEVAGRPRFVFLLSGEADTTVGGRTVRLSEGASATIRALDPAVFTAVTDAELLFVTVDASREPDYWRPIA
ncbi:MAG: cupin domain-containing protein [Acidimicrobiia bacterium]